LTSLLHHLDLFCLSALPGFPLQHLMVLLGDASYAIYLTHVLVMISYATVLKGSLANLPQWPVIPIVVLLSVGLGLFIHLFVERRLIAGTRALRLRVEGQAPFL
jgi:exopolysaccharide production protein ExoZ